MSNIYQKVHVAALGGILQKATNPKGPLYQLVRDCVQEHNLCDPNDILYLKGRVDKNTTVKELTAWIEKNDNTNEAILLVGKSFGAWNIAEALYDYPHWTKADIFAVGIDAQCTIRNMGPAILDVPAMDTLSIRQRGFMGGAVFGSSRCYDLDVNHLIIETHPETKKLLSEFVDEAFNCRFV